MKYRIIVLLTLILPLFASAQMVQTIRGTIIDQDSKIPLDGVTVMLIGSNNQGAITDENGQFKINSVPVGRVSLSFKYIGYEDKYLNNLLLNSGKELVLQIELNESLASLKTTVVKARKAKKQVRNEMAIASSRSFSVEETKRYAGSIDDPARLVSAFAGVNIDAEGNNSIVVRGNSSKGILWRMEGMEIPNPNHFANEGSTGGPISALNSNMLANSDFLTGAFAPDYGNAVSGVFDMHLRKGNNEKKEYTATASILGLDLALEGPLLKEKGGSYLINYRYSTLDILERTGILDFGGVPRYQDINFNLQLPLNSKNKISLYGLGGLSSIDQSINDEVDGEETDRVLLKGKMNAGLGVLGFNHSRQLNAKSYIKTQLQWNSTLSKSHTSIPDSLDNLYEVVNDRYINGSAKIASTYHLKRDARNTFKLGFILDNKSYDLNEKYWSFITNQLENTVSKDGAALSLQTFATWKYRMSKDVTMVSGLHYMHLFLNNSSSIEPRLALQWKANHRNTFNAGFGIHSKFEAMSIYLAQDQLEDGSFVSYNKDLDLMKAAHFIVGNTFKINSLTSLKTEVFYQHLYDVPIEDLPGSSFSLINQSYGFTTRKLINEGKGRNYGLELTLERNLNKGFYYMSTLSLYQSLYTAKDGIERKSKFAGGHVLNVLIGKEYKIGSSSKDRTLSINLKTAWIGASRYTPIDLNASILLGDEVRMEDQPFSMQGDDILKIDFSVGIRRNHKKHSSEWKIDIQNVSNNKAVVSEYYFHAKEDVVQGNQLPLLPVLSYKWMF